MKKKLLSLMLAGMMSIGVCGTALAAEGHSTLGFVDMQVIVTNFPGIKDIAQAIADKQAALQKDFNNKAEKLDDQGKLQLQAKYNQQLADFENKKMQPVHRKINQTINAVAAKKGVDSVVNINAMVAGGTNLTNDVVKELNK